VEILGIVFLLNLALSFVAGSIASSKGRSAFGYFVLSFFFSFLLAILVLIALPPISTLKENETRECPFCKERILRRAVVCKHCGRDVEAIPDGLSLSQQQAQAVANYKGNKWVNIGGVSMLLGAFLIWIWITSLNDPTAPTYGKVGIGIIDFAILGLGIFWFIKGTKQDFKENPTPKSQKSESKE
jgi:large-conductance mechanosensitive channel